MRSGGIDHFGIQHFACSVHNSQFAAGSKSRIPAQHCFARNGRLQQKLLQVLSEHRDSAVFRLFRQFAADVPLDGRRNQPFIAVLDSLLQNRCGDRIFLCNHLLLQITQNTFHWRFHSDGEEFFILTPVQGQYPMACRSVHRLGIVIIHLIDALCLFIFGRTDQFPFFKGHPSDIGPVLRIVGNIFGDNIPGTLQRFLRCCHTFFLIDPPGGNFQRRLSHLLLQNQFRQR